MKELKAEIRNKLQSLRMTIEQLVKGKEVPSDMLQTNLKDLESLEGLVDGINEGEL